MTTAPSGTQEGRARGRDTAEARLFRYGRTMPILARQPDLGASLQTFETCLYLVALGRYPTHQDRWLDAASRATAAINDLIAIQEEYKDWLANMPESLQSGGTGEMLQEIENLDLEGALSTLEEAEGISLPRGFGRD